MEKCITKSRWQSIQCHLVVKPRISSQNQSDQLAFFSSCNSVNGTEPTRRFWYQAMANRS